MAGLLRSPDGQLVSAIDETKIRSWSDQFSKMPGIAEMQGQKQWRNLKGEITRLSSLGFVPPYGNRWKNALYEARERVVRLFHA